MPADVPRLKPATLAFLMVTALSSAGTGLVYPLAAIYLSRTRHLGLGVASGYFAATAVAGVCVSFLAGLLVDRVGARAVAVAAIGLEGAGLCLFAGATDLRLVLAAGLLVGAGRGAFFAALTPLLSAFESGPALDHAFAFRYWTINLASGVGLVAGGAVAVLSGETGYPVLFLINGLTSLVFAAVTAFLPTSAPTVSAGRNGARFTGFARDARFLTLLVANTLTTMFGFALFESVVPAVLVLGSGVSAAVANGMVLASIVVVVLVQLPLSRWTRHLSRTLLLGVQSAIWAGASLLALVMSMSLDAPWYSAVTFGLLFGLGECFYALGFQSLVVDTVPRSILGQCNGVISLLDGVGLAAGPPIGFWLAVNHPGASLWLVMAFVAAATAVLWTRVSPVGAGRRAVPAAGVIE